MRPLLLIANLVIALLSVNAMALVCPTLMRADHAFDEAGYSRGLLWRVESRRGRVSHLFGTIHVSDPRVTDLPEQVAEVLVASKSFGMEVLLDRAAMLEMSQAMYFHQGENLEKILASDLFTHVVRLLANYGVSRTAAQSLKPWAAYTTLSLPPQQTEMPLDVLLLAAAEQGGKATFGLETIAEQVAVFDSLSLSDQTTLLLEAVGHYDEFQSELETMIDRYVARDLAAMMRMSLRYNSPLHERFMDALLWRRNRRMAERMQPHLREGGAFIALGALHLPGEGGVLDILSKQGFLVDPVY